VPSELPDRFKPDTLRLSFTVSFSGQRAAAPQLRNFSVWTFTWNGRVSCVRTFTFRSQRASQTDSAHARDDTRHISASRARFTVQRPVRNMKAAIEPITIRSAAIGRHRDSRNGARSKAPARLVRDRRKRLCPSALMSRRGLSGARCYHSAQCWLLRRPASLEPIRWHSS